MDDEQATRLWTMVRRHGDALTKISEACLSLANQREADKLVIEQLGATVELLDARVAMLEAQLADD